MIPKYLSLSGIVAAHVISHTSCRVWCYNASQLTSSLDRQQSSTIYVYVHWRIQYKNSTRGLQHKCISRHKSPRAHIYLRVVCECICSENHMLMCICMRFVINEVVCFYYAAHLFSLLFLFFFRQLPSARII